MAELDLDPDHESYDILDETLTLFRANTLFRNFEIKGPADRVLIYGILWISDCLSKVKASMTLREAEKAVTTAALEQYALPGDPSFPLNALYQGPKDRGEAEILRGYIGQMRQELGSRLLARIYADGTGKPSKVCVILSLSFIFAYPYLFILLLLPFLLFFRFRRREGGRGGGRGKGRVFLVLYYMLTCFLIISGG